MNTQKIKKGFTLIELIVVITILAILGTIAFVSFNSYSSSARDSARITDLSNISKSLVLYKTDNGSLPLPNNYTEFTDSTGTLLYQGVVGEQLASLLNISKGLQDPIDGTKYIYSLSFDKNYSQVGGYLENQNVYSFFGNRVLASVDYNKRYFNTKGDSVGIILDDETNAPIYSGAVISGVSHTGTMNIVSSSKKFRVIINRDMGTQTVSSGSLVSAIIRSTNSSGSNSNNNNTQKQTFFNLPEFFINQNTPSNGVNTISILFGTGTNNKYSTESSGSLINYTGSFAIPSSITKVYAQTVINGSGFTIDGEYNTETNTTQYTLSGGSISGRAVPIYFNLDSSKNIIKMESISVSGRYCTPRIQINGGAMELYSSGTITLPSGEYDLGIGCGPVSGRYVTTTLKVTK